MSLLNQTMKYQDFMTAFDGITSRRLGEETGYTRKTIEKWRHEKKDITGTAAIALNALKDLLEQQVSVTRTGKEWLKES